MREILLSTILSCMLSCTPALADEFSYSFDHDGGKCDGETAPYGAEYAYVNHEGMIYIETSIRQAPGGEFAIHDEKIIDDVIQYRVTNLMFNKEQFINVSEDGFIFEGEYKTPYDFRKEGNVDVVKMLPCDY